MTLFQDNASSINIPSDLKVKFQTQSMSCQTMPFSALDKECQSISLINEQTQTPNQNIYKTIHVEMPALVAFMNSVEPMVSRTLLSNLKSKAFHGYSVSWEEDIDDISLLGVLSMDVQDMAALCAKFNPSGALIAVAYGHQHHETWCPHKGRVCVWNIKSRDLNYERSFFSTETSNCVSSLDFHPTIPGLLAVGTFNGEISLYSVFRETSFMVASSSRSEKSHSEAIGAVLWKKSVTNSYDLLSIGNDGKILVWDESLKEPKTGCQLLSFGLSIKKGLRQDVVLGGTTLCTSKFNSNELIVGTETGYLLKVGMNKFSSMNENGSVISNGILFCYESHMGQINAVDLSPFYRNAIASSSADGTLKLYSALQTKALYILEPSNNSLGPVSWSPSRPCVLVTGSAHGYIYIYDFRKNLSTPFVSFLAVSRPEASILTVNFNNTGQLAVGDSYGKVMLWQLSTYLTKSQESEEKFLVDMFENSK